MDLKKTIKDWMLPIAMVTGASIYLIYYILPEPIHRAGPFLSGAVSILQPLLIFSMLFLTFCRIEPKDLKPHRWHWWLLLIQGGLFSALGLLALWVIKAFPGDFHDKVVLIESAMLCLICPTATAAAVVTRKLGGDVAGITTYTVLINLVTFFLFFVDKLKAKRKEKRESIRRVPEKTLFLLAAVGGSVGALLGMKVWHHKTLHKTFRYGIPAVAQLPINPKIAGACDRGLIELFEGNWLDTMVDVCLAADNPNKRDGMPEAPEGCTGSCDSCGVEGCGSRQ